MVELILNLLARSCQHGPRRVGWSEWAGGLLPWTSERFPEGMQNTLKTSVADPNQVFSPLSDIVPHSYV